MKLVGKLSEILSKGDIYYKAIYCYGSSEDTELIARCDSKYSIKQEIAKYIDDIEDMEDDFILVYEYEYVSKEDGANKRNVYEYEYGKLELIKSYIKEAK